MKLNPNNPTYSTLEKYYKQFVHKEKLVYWLIGLFKKIDLLFIDSF